MRDEIKGVKREVEEEEEKSKQSRGWVVDQSKSDDVMILGRHQTAPDIR